MFEITRNMYWNPSERGRERSKKRKVAHQKTIGQTERERERNNRFALIYFCTHTHTHTKVTVRHFGMSSFDWGGGGGAKTFGGGSGGGVVGEFLHAGKRNNTTRNEYSPKKKQNKQTEETTRMWGRQVFTGGGGAKGRPTNGARGRNVGVFSLIVDSSFVPVCNNPILISHFQSFPSEPKLTHFQTRSD